MGYFSRVVRRLKARFVNWLLSDVVIEQMRVLDLHVGMHSVKIYPDHIDVNGGAQIYKTYIDGQGNFVIKNISGLQLPVGSNKYVT